MGDIQKRQHTASFKAKVGIEAIKEIKTISEIGSENAIHPTQVRRWKTVIESKATDLFTDTQGGIIKQKDELINRLYHQVGKLQLQVDWLKKKMGLPDD
jgi:putative transposase